IPMPTVVVLDADGVIGWIDVHANYATRSEPADILAGFGVRDGSVLVELGTPPRPEQVREAILDAILAGRFEDDRLPPERDLSKMMRVSRTTIRAALQSLDRSGIVTRRRAIGTTINRHVDPSMLALQRLVGFDWL